MMNKISDIIDGIRDVLEWIISGCPKPILTPIKDGRNGKKRK